MDSIYRKLNQYWKTDYYPFHMPGHKRNMEGYPMQDFYHIDITEIDGFDDLHHAEGLLRESMECAAALYQSAETYFLVNGATCGILSAISAAVKKGGKILLARNCHKSAYNAVMLRELAPIFLYPEIRKPGIFGGISADSVEQALRNETGIEAVFITSPTYEGEVTDVRRIVSIAHEYGVPLIVDEAHGAHFGFYEGFPDSSVSCGADLVVHSLHKTLPSLTQTAVLHRNGNLVSRQRLLSYLSIYQSSSPSYILMASIDSCISVLERDKNVLFQNYLENLYEFYKKCKGFKHLKVIKAKMKEGNSLIGRDPGRILISTENANIGGAGLYQLLLNKYHLQMEMAAPEYVIALTGIMDTQEGFQRLAAALHEIDGELSAATGDSIGLGDISISIGERNFNLPIWNAADREPLSIALEEASGRRSAEYIYLYPPGTPILVPGEIITSELLKLMKNYIRAGFQLHGLQKSGGLRINVI